jgi:hypothetical protein
MAMKFINEMWGRLFNAPPSPEDIQLQMKEVEREQKHKRRDMELKDEDKSRLMKDALAAQKAGKREKLQDVYRDLQQLEIDKNYIAKDLRRLSLSKTALSSFLRKVQSLEKHHDHKSMESVILRFNQSKELQRAIDSADVSDEAFNSMLEGVLDEETTAVVGSRVREDSGFAAFEQALGKMTDAESGGAAEEPDFSKFQHEIDRAIKAEKSAGE